jgi:SAM-dependent methyltransferase
MPDFTRRADTPELMDAEDVPFEDYRACLRDLERVNIFTFAYRPTLGWLDALRDAGRLPRGRAVSIVDIGGGGGDMLRRIRRWADRRRIEAKLIGLDRDPRAARAASELTPPGNGIDFVTADLFEWVPQGPVDLVISSLFAHHLDDAALVRFLAWMEGTAQVGWFVNDLHRHVLPWMVFRPWSRLAGWHRFVRHDGPVSITRAFTEADWRALLDEAGIPAGAADIAWRMPFRLCVSRVKGP